jgi:hypothetical protein
LLALLFQSRAEAVGHEVEPLTDVRSADARRAQIERCAGVVRCFQVIVNQVPPSQGIAARNLLSKDDARAALLDEVVPGRPEVPLVSSPAALTCLAERLAGAATSPD